MRFKPNYAATKEAIIDSRNIYNCIMLPLVYTKIRDLDYEVLCSKEPIAFSKMKKMKFKNWPKINLLEKNYSIVLGFMSQELVM